MWFFFLCQFVIATYPDFLSLSSPKNLASRFFSKHFYRIENSRKSNKFIFKRIIILIFPIFFRWNDIYLFVRTVCIRVCVCVCSEFKFGHRMRIVHKVNMKRMKPQRCDYNAIQITKRTNITYWTKAYVPATKPKSIKWKPWSRQYFERKTIFAHKLIVVSFFFIIDVRLTKKAPNELSSHDFDPIVWISACNHGFCIRWSRVVCELFFHFDKAAPN